jgi:DNA-binding transcriptional LysR family regulator
MHWDDLRYVLAVHRTGSLAGAARALNVSHVTVFRRIECLEKDLGVRLFDRKRQGYVATALAAEIVQQAEQVEEQINALERRVWRQDSEVHGTVRLTSTDTISATVLPGVLARLREKHPRLVIENIISHDQFSITRRDADIAIRHTISPPEMLIGHPLTQVHYAIYAGKKFAPRRGGKPPDFARLPWVSPDDSPVEYRFIKWIREHGHEPQVVLRCNSFVALAGAVKAGVGVGILSCFTAESLGGLVRLSPPIREVEWQYWVLTHPELRDVARVATVYSFLRKAFAELRPLFHGQASAA